MSASLLGQLLVSGVSSSFILLLTSLGLVIIMGYMTVSYTHRRRQRLQDAAARTAAGAAVARRERPHQEIP